MGDLGRIDGFTGDQVALALSWAREFEKRGLSSLPSRADEKRPLLPSYAQFWGGGLPPVDRLWRDFPSGNVQVMTGRKVVVLDLDGAPGIETFRAWCEARDYRLPPTWISSSDRREGKHLWFSVPRGIGHIPTIRPLWGVWDETITDRHGRVIGGWKRRSSVELLGDRSLVVAPPSIHPRTGKIYHWHAGSSPKQVRFPAPLPMWLLAIEPTRKPAPEVAPPPNRPLAPRRVSGGLDLPCSPSDVIRSVPALDVAVHEWGLKIASGRENPRGWVRCYDFNRPDENPSAGFRPRDGRFWRPEMGRESFCLFRLGVEMGHYGSWREACVDLGRRFLPHVFRSKANV